MKNSLIRIIDLNTRPALLQTAAAWFGSHWPVPTQTYLNSFQQALTSTSGVPRWYVAMNEEQEIIAGVGVIENDFHNRPDLTPNICALYVEKAYRGQGIAKALLDNACAQLAKNGVPSTYLITNHTTFYERCGWQFLGEVTENNGHLIRMYKYPQNKKAKETL